jgi:hypothetical protein
VVATQVNIADAEESVSKTTAGIQHLHILSPEAHCGSSIAVRSKWLDVC